MAGTQDGEPHRCSETERDLSAVACYLVLTNISKKHNLSQIIRSAGAFGVAQVHHLRASLHPDLSCVVACLPARPPAQSLSSMGVHVLHEHRSDSWRHGPTEKRQRMASHRMSCRSRHLRTNQAGSARVICGSLYSLRSLPVRLFSSGGEASVRSARRAAR